MVDYNLSRSKGLVSGYYCGKPEEEEEYSKADIFPILSRYMLSEGSTPNAQTVKSFYKYYSDLIGLRYSVHHKKRLFFLQSIASILSVNEHRAIDIRDYREQVRMSTEARIINFKRNK